MKIPKKKTLQKSLSETLFVRKNLRQANIG